VKRWIKRLFGIAALAGFITALVWAFLPKPTPVELAAVSRGLVQVYVEEDGKTRLRDRYTISAPLAGRLQRIKLKPGDVAPAGQPIAVIEPADPELLDPRALAQAEARVKAAQVALDNSGTTIESTKAALELAEIEYARAVDLHNRNALAKSELDAKVMQRRTKTAEYRAAKFAEDIAKFELELALAALVRTRPAAADTEQHARFEIRPPPLPGSGRVFHVLRVLQESAAVVTPGTPLLELGDMSDLEIEIDVLSNDAVKVRPGTSRRGSRRFRPSGSKSSASTSSPTSPIARRSPPRSVTGSASWPRSSCGRTTTSSGCR
jgi:HlyD family secretion protein